MHYGEKRWIEIDTMDKDCVVVVCPIGSLEQHGHHLPLLTDTYLVTEVAERVEKKLSDKVLLTPTLWLGASDHHLDFPGTLSVPNSFYVGMLKNIVRSFVRHGFRRIVFLNGHGGNIAPGEVAITEMAHSHDDCDGTMVVFANYWALAGDGFAPKKHGMQTPEVTHACEYETSMMQAVRDDLVHMRRCESRRADHRHPVLPQRTGRPRLVGQPIPPADSHRSHGASGVCHTRKRGIALVISSRRSSRVSSKTF